MINVKIDQKSMGKAYELLRHIPGAFPRAVAAAFEDRKEKQFSNELPWVQYTMRKKL